MEKVKIAFVGLGHRGPSLLGLLAEMKDVQIVGLCDLYQDRIDGGFEVLKKAGYKKMPLGTTDYRRLLEVPGVQAVVTPSSWTSHVKIILDAMEHGLYAATEVGGATSLDQCWQLVHTSERTGMPCMLLENCCYGEYEMAVLNMVKQGMFGELVHAEGGYRHDLRDEIATGKEERHYRLANYSNRNGDVYPTHDLGPIAKYLDINRGNRMVSLTSMASKSVGVNVWSQEHRGADDPLSSRKFTQGDVVVTNIKCAHGELITLFHDTSLPRPYSRANLLQGTKGIWQEDKNGIYLEGVSQKPHTWDKIESYFEKYGHPLWHKYNEYGVRGGHGGMDFLVLRAFVESVKNHHQTPIDVYDAAAWMSITTLSEDSINMGGAPVAIPDFTNGAWFEREPAPVTPYSLHEWNMKGLKM